MTDKIDRYFNQKKVWKIQQKNKLGEWVDTVLGDLPMRHGEALIHRKSAKLLGHPEVRIVKLENKIKRMIK